MFWNRMSTFPGRPRNWRSTSVEIAMTNENPSYVQLLGQSIKKMAIALDTYLDEIFQMSNNAIQSCVIN